MQKELKILLIADSLYMLAGGLFGSIYAVFVEKIGGDLLTAGTSYAAFALAAGILTFLISRWEDRIKHQEKFVVIGYALSCIGFAGYLLIQKPIDLFIVQIIFGFGEAVGSPAFDGLYSRSLDKGKFTSEWGMWDSMQWIITAISAAVGGFLANKYGFRFLFVIMLALSISGFIVSTFLVIHKSIKSKKLDQS